MSPTLTRVCSIADVPPDSIRRFDVEGHAIAVYNLDGTFYATDDACTHGMSSLSEGELDGDIVECSLHLGAFHIPTGKPAGAPCSIPLKTYRTEVSGDDVSIEWSASTPKNGDPQWVPVQMR
ncbi:non-heme iron oxygenase ferredoxin subunit [Paraburkholderia jirisanensis]